MEQNLNYMVDLASTASVFLSESLTSFSDNILHWEIDGRELLIDIDKKEFQFVGNWFTDEKTYFALIGLALSNSFTTGDYSKQD